MSGELEATVLNLEFFLGILTNRLQAPAQFHPNPGRNTTEATERTPRQRGGQVEGLMLKLKLQYFGHLMQRVDSLEKTLMLGGIGGKRRRE